MLVCGLFFGVMYAAPVAFLVGWLFVPKFSLYDYYEMFPSSIPIQETDRFLFAVCVSEMMTMLI